MIVSWVVALGLIVFAQVATRNMRRVPEGAQNFLEWLVEGLYKFL
jgi:F-type H+-transporting ATPase subunit a